jgi:hypothetical protein
MSRDGRTDHDGTPRPGDRWARLAVRAYPGDVRAEREQEMLDTLRDIRTAAPDRYGRELADLVRLGIRTRAIRTAATGPGRLIADGFAVGAILIMMLELADIVSHRMRGLHGPLLSTAMIVPLAVILAVALLRLDRLAAAGGIVWLAVRAPDLYRAKGSLIGVAPAAVLLACFAVMLAAPRTREGRIGWAALLFFAAPGALVAVLGPPRPHPLLVLLLALAALVTVLTALTLAATDPRFGVACAMPAAYIGAQIVWKPQAPIAFSVITLGALPFFVILVVLRTRALRRTGRV